MKVVLNFLIVTSFLLSSIAPASQAKKPWARRARTTAVAILALLSPRASALDLSSNSSAFPLPEGTKRDCHYVVVSTGGMSPYTYAGPQLYGTETITLGEKPTFLNGKRNYSQTTELSHLPENTWPEHGSRSCIGEPRDLPQELTITDHRRLMRQNGETVRTDERTVLIGANTYSVQKEKTVIEDDHLNTCLVAAKASPQEDGALKIERDLQTSFGGLSLSKRVEVFYVQKEIFEACLYRKNYLK